MGNRRRARELAMQALFYMDTQHTLNAEALDRFCQTFAPSKKALPFFTELVSGVMKERERIDAVIERFSSNWKMSRMSCVDRNILRIAVYELLYCADIPSKVSINEAIDIGKKYGAEDSGAFINGILDSIRLAADSELLDLPRTEPAR
ncbi:MAG: transcription antitermination factor NusB [Desulfobacterales bacterium]|jgi:N utilization substance protein B